LKQKLQGIINPIIKLKATINVAVNKIDDGKITAGHFIPCFYGAKGFVVSNTVQKALVDSEGYVLVDSNNEILTVIEGED